MSEGNPKEGRTTADVQGAYFAPGKAAEHPQGILYQGDYQNESDGTGIAIRLNVRALATTGLPVLLKPFTGTVLTQRGLYESLHVAGVSDAVREDVGAFTTTSISSLHPVIRHFVCHKAEEISRRVMRGALGSLDDPELLLRARKTLYGGSVLYSVWERDRIDHATVRELSQMGDNWVPCQQNADMLLKCGVPNVAVIPHPYDPESPLLKLTRRKPMKSRRFYWIGRWEPRKNPVDILWAFFGAIRPGDDAHLTMKYHGQWEGYPTLVQTLDSIIEETEWTREQIDAHLTTIQGYIRPDQILKLHFENNIYLAPSAGEAWCLPAFEAKLAGNRVIHTPYGGTQDFCDPIWDLEVPYTMGDVPLTYGWPAGSQWARISLQGLQQQIETVTPPSGYHLNPIFEERFSLKAVGALMRARLVERFGNTKSGEYLK
jgi:hypothetical protein